MFRALPIEGHKNIIQPAIFGVSRWLPFEGEKRNLSKWLIFDPSRCLPDGREIFKTIHKNRVFVLYHLRREKLLRQRRGFWLSSLPTYWGKKNIFFKRLNFRFFSWSTPWGRKFRSRHNFWPLQVGTSEEIFKTEVKKRVSRCLPFEGTKLFLKTPTKTTSPSGNK